MIEILNSDHIHPDDIKAIQNLYRQLNPDIKQRNVQHVLQNGQNTKLFIYRKDGKIAGMASLAWYVVISGFKGWVEDVVVDQNLRGKGMGKQLIEKVLEEGKNLGLSHIFLYTEEKRKVAIHLYEGLGFQRKNSNIYVKQNE